MSYESVPCGSPESQTVVEDPAPSLYSGDDDNRFIKTIKRPQEVPESTRLADTAKIEDEIIMNEEQIARVTGRINPAPPLEPPVLTRISPRRNFCEGREVEIELRDESSRRNAVRARYLGNQWIDLNDVNPQVAEKNHSTEYVEKQNLDYESMKGNRSKFLQERGERDGRVSAGVSVIKSSREQEVDSESDTESSSRSTKKTGLPGKEDSVSLVCNENISAEQLRDERSEIMHRPHIYNYGFSHEDNKNPRVSRVPENESSSGKDKLISGRQSVGESGEGKKVEKGEHGGTVPPVSVYYMPYSPHMASISRARQAGLISRGNASVPHAHLGGRASEQLAHLAISDGRGGYRIQQLEYRPEQQVPIANSSEENTERNVMMTGVSHNGAVQYVDRQGLFPGGFAVLPGIGTVRVMDGMFFHQPSIPLGPDGSHYENFASVSSFVPMTSLQGQTTSSPSPSVNASLTCDSNAAQPQEKTSSVAKSFTSQTQPQPVSSFPNLDDKRPISSPAVQSDRDSPAPSTDDGDNKKFPSTRQRNKQRPLGGAKSEIKCDQCGKIFGSSSALAKHKLTHSDERRYVCQICSKGFKRQDHLNGHMVTHRDKKPYECSFADCDKSYCDMRSLRRHLENHHAALAASSNATSVTTTTGNKQTNTVTAVTVVPDVGHVEVAAGQNASRVRIKTVRGDKKDTDESSSGGGHYQAGGYDSGKSSGRSTPSAPHEIVPLRDRLISQIARERNSDSISSGTSEETGAHTGETSRGHTPETASHAESKFVAVNLLKQAAERAQEEREKQSGERFQQHPYMAYQEGFPYQQWYPAGMYSQDPRIVYQYPQGIMFPSQAYPVNSVTGIGPDVQSHQVTSHHFSGDHRDIGKSPLKSVNQLRSSPREHSSGGEGHQMPFLTHPKARIAAGTPTNPTAVAVGAAKNLGKYQFTRESYYGVHPSGTQWQQVRYDDNTAVSFATEHKQGLMGNNKSMRTHAHSESSEEIDSDNARHYGKYTLYRAAHKDDSFGTAAKRAHADQNFSSSRIDRREYEQMLALQEAQLKVKIEDNNNYENQANGPSKTSGDASGVFRNPSDILSPRRKQKPKLEPLKIPDHVSTSFQPGSPKNRSRPCTPPIYTPPPMLSPHSIFSHIARPITPRSSGIPQLPMTPSRLRLSNRSCRNSVEADEESYQFPEPKINIGSQFQAEIPEFVGQRNVCVDSHPANLVWSPMDERKRAKRDEIESYLDVACSVAVQGGGSNKEYALHILHRANGNIKEAVHDLLKRKSFFSSTDFMHGYRYEGSVKWAAKERQTFRNSFRVKGKEFSDLKKEVGTKSVHDCVEFYYLWKATHPEAVRGRTRYIDSNSDEDYEDTSSETNSNPSLFECDFPQCSAKFVSRQALNGHIRVHGGSFMKTEPRKRSRTPASSSPATSSETVPPVKKRRPAVPSLPPSNPSDPDSPLPEYPCKVCGRVFPKIKSRSAHMKTHVKRPESHDDEKNGAVIVKAH